MGLRVNKRIKIAKGISLNIGKKGISTSIKIGNTTINSRGRVSTRIAPGVSYTTNLSSNKKKRNTNRSANTNSNENDMMITQSRQIKEKNKFTSIILCCLGFLGIGGIHKFYEGKILMGIIYFITFGFFFIGTIVDLLVLLSKPNTYYI